jgi:hypothetical protein
LLVSVKILAGYSFFDSDKEKAAGFRVETGG